MPGVCALCSMKSLPYELSPWSEKWTLYQITQRDYFKFTVYKQIDILVYTSILLRDSLIIEFINVLKLINTLILACNRDT